MNAVTDDPLPRAVANIDEPPSEVLLAHAKIVTGDEIVHGNVQVVNGLIAGIDTASTSLRGAVDLQGDFLLPGLIDVHTDNLEKHAIPRPGVFWEKLSAAIAHDNTIIGAGITTVFDSLCVGALGKPDRRRALPLMVSGLAAANELGLLRAEHLLHLRCDVTEPNLRGELTPYLHDPSLKFITMLEDSSRRDPAHFKTTLKRRGLGADAEPPASVIAGNREWLAHCCRQRNIVWGNHDDTKDWHIAEGRDLGMLVAEFPVTREAARAARDAGMIIVGGAPNLVAGRSHAGGLSMRELASERMLNILCSDYVPASLLQAAFVLARDPIGMPLAAAVGLVSRAPAELFGLTDRGSIAIGNRADFIHVALKDEVPVVRRVWRNGRRVL
jgi:alpha-D-ribose 1-methylphosphonate 5-triphosphate diphosphatase